MDEIFLKHKIAYAYFSDPNSNLEELKELADYDQYTDAPWRMPLIDKERILFLIRVNLGTNKGHYFYFLSKYLLEE